MVCNGQERYSFLMSVYWKVDASDLARSMECMFAQTIPPSEVVIVKDGTLPESLEAVLSGYENDYPNVMKIIGYPDNQGLWYALRLGLEECSNELVARMDSDDYAEPCRLEEELEVMRRKPSIDCVGSNVVEFEGSIDNRVSYVDLPSEHDDILRFGKRRCPFRHSSLLYKKSAVQRAGSYQEMPLFEDYDLFMRMVKTGARFYNIPKPLVFMGVNSDFFQRRGDVGYLKKMVRFRKTCLKRGDVDRLEYLTSVIPHAAVCLMPNGLRTVIYKNLLRKDVA